MSRKRGRSKKQVENICEEMSIERGYPKTQEENTGHDGEISLKRTRKRKSVSFNFDRNMPSPFVPYHSLASSLNENELREKWQHGRTKELALLLSVMRSCSTIRCIDIFGPPATGKTSLVLDVLALKGLPFAYANCLLFSSQRELFDTLLFQMGNDITDSSSPVSTFTKRCLTLSSFSRQVSNLFRQRLPCEMSATQSYFIILDNADHMSSRLSLSLQNLLRLSESSGTACVFVLISGGFHSSRLHITTSCGPTIAVHFPAYTSKILSKILTTSRPSQIKPSDYRTFVDYLVFLARLQTRSVVELSKIVYRMMPHFERLLKDQQKQHEQVSVGEDQDLPIHQYLAPLYSQENETLVDISMPLRSKYLLLSGFVASHNSPSSDIKIFGADTKRVRKKRKRNAPSSSFNCSSGSTEIEQRFLFPRAFVIERMLAIFNSIYGEDDVYYFSAISSFIKYGFMSPVNSVDSVDSLQEVRLRCMISLQLAQRIAESMQFELERYLDDPATI